MAKFFKPSKQLKSRKHASASKQLAHFSGITQQYDLSLKGIVANPHQRVAFVPGVMLGEEVKVKPLSYTDKVIQGEVIEVLSAHPDRIKAHCQYFEQCGGCQLQYMPNHHQVEAKQQAFAQLLSKQLKVSGVELAPAIDSSPYAYRRAARLAIWWTSKSKVNIGFREAKSKQIVDIDKCPILTNPLQEITVKLKPLLLSLSGGQQVSHVQLFDLTHYQCAVFRVTGVLSIEDQQRLVNFASGLDVHFLIEFDDNRFELLHQASHAQSEALHYEVDEIKFEFTAKDFIQVNESVNHAMIAQAMEWLAPQPEDIVLDLFSGVGNFTLPLAKRAKQVIGVEGVHNMVKQLKHNAAINGFDNVEAYQADLSVFDEKRPPKWLRPIDKLLLDPARDGAFAVMQTIPKLKPKQILYISCNPTTMIRDLKVLLSAGYKLKRSGILNMFPNTAHMEAMVLLEK